MKKKYSLLLLLFAFAIYPNISFGYFSLDSHYVLLNDSIRNTSITVLNSGNKAHSYKVSLEHYRQNTDGSYTKVNKESSDIKFADKYIIYTPIMFVINAHSAQIVRIQRKPMPDASPGEYISHMVVTEIPNIVDYQHPNLQKIANQKSNISINITAGIAISIPLIVRKGNLKAQAIIVKAKLASFKNNSNSVDHKLEVYIARFGNKSIRGFLELVDDKGTVLLKVDGINLLLSSTYRKLLLSLDEKVIKKYKNKNLELNFIDKFTKKILANRSIKL